LARPKSVTLDLSVLGQHQIARLDVAMDEPLLRGVPQTGGRLHDVPGRHRRLERSALARHRLERSAADQLHREVRDRPFLTGGVDLGDVRMVERRRGTRLAGEAGDELRVGRQRREERLERTSRCSASSTAR